MTFALEQRKNYQAGILGQAPQTSNRFEANKVDPVGAAISGGMAGFGFQKENPDSFGGGTPTMQTSTYGTSAFNNRYGGGK